MSYAFRREDVPVVRGMLPFLLLFVYIWSDTTCFVGGGNDFAQVWSQASTECYFPSLGRWEIVPNLLLPSTNAAMVAFNLGPIACIAGGYDHRNSVSVNTVLCTNGTGWTPMPNLKTTRGYAAPIYGQGWVGVAAGLSPGWDYASLPNSITSVSSLNLSWASSPMVLLRDQDDATVLSLNGTTCLVGGEQNIGTIKVRSSSCARLGNSPSLLNWMPGPNVTILRDGAVGLHFPDAECIAGGATNPDNNPTTLTIDCLPITTDPSQVQFFQPASFTLPVPTAYAANFSMPGLTCFGGGNRAGALKEVWCANYSRAWVPFPWLNLPRETPAVFTLTTTLNPPPSPVYQLGSNMTCVAGGYGPGPSVTDTTECYNETTRTWTIIPSLTLFDTTSTSTSIQLGSLVCLGGGKGDGDVLMQCTNGTSWLLFPNIPLPNAYNPPIYGPGWVGLLSYSNSNIMSTSTIPSGLRADPTALSFIWVQRTLSLPVTRVNPTMLTLNGSLCMVGGYGNSTTYLSTTVCLSGVMTPDFSSPLQWIPGPSITAARNGGVPILLPGRSCTGGGGPYPFLSTIDCYNTTKPFPSFTQSYFSLPLPLAWAANATLAGMQCIMGGTTTASVQTRGVYCLNISGPSWIPFPSLVEPRESGASFTIVYGGPPTLSPTTAPTLSPTKSPTISPTTQIPTTATPTAAPSAAPTTSAPTAPLTSAPSVAPTTSAPTVPLTSAPTPTISAWWQVTYSSRFVNSQSSTFTIVSSTPPPGTPSPIPIPQWLFSTGYRASGVVVTIPPYNFTAGENYTFWTEIGNVRSELYQFEIVVTPLVVAVTGGDKDVLAGSVVTLDASGSYDPDVSPNNNPAPLQFQWSSNCAHGVIVGSSSSTTINIQTGAPETACQANIIVSTNLPPPHDKPANRSVLLKVVPSLVCNVSISGPTEGLIMVSDTLRLLATVSTPSTQTALTLYQWSVQPSISCALPPSTTADSRALSLPPWCLQAGVSYRFSFTAGNNAGSTQAFYAITAVGAPSGGSCSISPLTGLAVLTPFTVSCSDWTQQGTVSVSFTYAVATLGSLLTTAQSQSVVTFTLPESPALQGTNLSVEIYGYGGAQTGYQLPLVKVSRAPTCPLSNLSLPTSDVLVAPQATLQDFTVAFQQILLLASSSGCSAALRNASWQVLWHALQQVMVEGDSAITSSSQLSYLATSFAITIATSPPRSLSSPSGLAALLDIVSVFADNARSPSTAQKILETSSALYSFMEGNCTASNKLAVLLAQLVRASTAGNLPSDPSLQVNTGGVTVTSGSYFGDSASSINSNGVAVDLPSALLSQGGDVSVVTVTGYSNAQLPACRSTSGGLAVASQIVDITLSTREGELVGVRDVQGESFAFTVPLIAASCGPTSCSWWDTTHNSWNSSGCRSSKDPTNNALMICTCTHLTEFALLLQPVECRSLSTAFLVLLALYAAVALVILAKLIYRFLQLGAKKVGMLFWQHVLMLVLALARGIASLSLGVPDVSATWLLPGRAAILILPYLITFWIYTLMVFQWASVFHFGMKHKADAFKQVQWLFIVSNTAVGAAVIVLLCTFAVDDSNHSLQESIAIGATSTLAAVTFITAIAFLAYATLLRNSMNAPSTLSRTQSRSSVRRMTSTIAKGVCCDCDVKHKIFFGGVAICMLLCLQASMHIASVVAQSASDRSAYSSKSVIFSSMWEELSECIVLAADLLSLVVLLVMYHRAMSGKSKVDKSTQALEMSQKPSLH